MAISWPFRRQMAPPICCTACRTVARSPRSAGEANCRASPAARTAEETTAPGRFGVFFLIFWDICWFWCDRYLKIFEDIFGDIFGDILIFQIWDTEFWDLEILDGWESCINCKNYMYIMQFYYWIGSNGLSSQPGKEHAKADPTIQSHQIDFHDFKDGAHNSQGSLLGSHVID